jgi:hypothetical protein
MPGKEKQESVVWRNLFNYTRGYAPQAVQAGEAETFSDLGLRHNLTAVPAYGTVALTGDLGTYCQGVTLSGTVVIFVYDGKVGSAANSGTLPLTPVVKATGTTYTTTPCTFVPFGTHLAIIGVDARPYDFNIFSNTCATLAGSPPDAITGAAFADRLWLVGSGANTNIVYFSGLNDCTSWTTGTDYLTIGSALQDGPITGIISVGDALYVFTRVGIYQITGRTTNDFYVRCFSSTNGLAAGDSSAICAVADETMMWYCRGNIWVRSGGPRSISTQLEGELATVYAAPLAMAWHEYDNTLYVAVPTSATAGYTLVWDMNKKAWYKWTIPISCFMSPGGIKNPFYAGLRTGQFVAIVDTTTRLGVAMAPAVGEVYTNFGLPDWEKWLRHIMVWGTCAAATGTVTIKYRTLEGSDNTVTKTGLTFPTMLNLPKYRFVDLSVKVESSSAASFTYRGMKVGFIPVRQMP